jgi:hypothetical protein
MLRYIWYSPTAALNQGTQVWELPNGKHVLVTEMTNIALSKYNDSRLIGRANLFRCFKTTLSYGNVAPYRHGLDARLNNIECTERNNPYMPGTWAHAEWVEGWKDCDKDTNEEDTDEIDMEDE